ncbi:MAG: glycosyltransferase family 4 protein [Akkermansiaceae bacterium]
MSAFACEPEEGSEPEVGWRWARMMSRDNDVIVVTQEKNRKHIEPFLEKHPDICQGVTFVYHEFWPTFRRLKRRFSWLMLPYYTMWQWSLRKKVSQLLEVHSVDLIHHVTFASFRMPVFLTGRPVIWGPVGGADTAPDHLLGHLGSWHSIIREKVRNWSTGFAIRLLPWIDPSVKSGGMAFASTPGTGEAFKRNGIPAKILPTVGMVPQKECRMDFSPPGQPLRLLFVGRLHHLKGLQFIFEAMRGLPKKEAILTVVGSGPLEKRLRELVAKMDLEDRVHFKGFVARPKLPEIYLTHDLLVAPSLYESGGLSILEAFSFGLPAVALKRGGPALSINDQCGVLVEVDQEIQGVCLDLREAVKKYSSNRELLAKHGGMARERLGGDYSWEGKRARMQEAYENVVCRDEQDG